MTVGHGKRAPTTPVLPENAVKYSESPVFTEATIPDGLRSVHRTKADVWGVLRVLEGAVGFQDSEPPGEEERIEASQGRVIEPDVPHRLIVFGPVRLRIEFYRIVGDA